MNQLSSQYSGFLGCTKYRWGLTHLNIIYIRLLNRNIVITPRFQNWLYFHINGYIYFETMHVCQPLWLPRERL